MFRCSNDRTLMSPVSFIPHRIHGTGIIYVLLVDFLMLDVGKYSIH